MEWEMTMSTMYNNNEPIYLYGALPSADTMRIDDLLDFSNNDMFAYSGAEGNGHAVLAPTYETPCNGFSSQSSSFDICIPHEEEAELEWLSKFVDDSFSDIPSYQYNTKSTPNSTITSIPLENHFTAPIGRGSRTKRSKTTPNSTVTSWSSPSPSSSCSSSEFPQSKPKQSNIRAKRSSGENSGNCDVLRRCTHCASEKTPQWRTGPMGPKTLCNACGVRYKSGRLVPEYRPAASPTFVLTQHSNSHRKVVELRRQKEMLMSNNSANAVSQMPELMYNEYSVC